MESQGEQSTHTPPFASQPSPASGTSSDLLRPRYFVVRKDGTLTPLIAVDELPDSIRIIGVPPTISPAATLNMMSLGVVDRSQHKYMVETSDLSVGSNPGKLSPPLAAHGSNSSIPEKPLVASNGEVHKGTTVSGAKGVEQWRQDVKSIDETQAAIDAVIDANENATSTAVHTSQADAGTPGTFGKKVYCTHWIRWGECDYTQQGCLYKHEMPDELTLNSIGIRTIPKWFRDVNAPKNGWVGRPAPSDQLWRGKQARPSQVPQPVKPFHGPTQPPNSSAWPVRPLTAASRPNTNGSFTGAAPSSYQPPVPPGPKVFGRANPTPEQRHTPAFVSVVPNQPISTPPILHTTRQPMQSFTLPNLSPFTSPPTATRNSNIYNLTTSLLPNYGIPPNYPPLTPSLHNPTPAVPNSVLAPLPKPTSPAYEPQTPEPMHRRLFVPAGEAKFVTNPVPASEGKGKAKEGKKGGKGGKEGRNGYENGAANGDFLVDLE